MSRPTHIERQHFARLQPHAGGRVDVHGLAGDEFRHARRVEDGRIPLHGGGVVAVEVREHEHGCAVVAQAHDGERVAVATRDQALAHAGTERGMRGEDAVQAGDEVHHVVGRIPVEVAAVVYVDLLGGVPLHAVRDAPRALVAEQRGELHAQTGVDLPALREAVVVVRLGKVDERTVLLRARDRAGQVPLERAAVVGLENLGVGPVEVGTCEQGVRDLELAAEALEHEHGVGVLLAYTGDDVVPRLLGDHVARVAAEAVHAEPAPEEEHVGHVGAQLGLRVVELHEVGPRHAPRAGRDERAVGLAVEPVGVVGLERGRPAGVIGGEVDEETPAARVDGVHELAELVEGRRLHVKLGACGIDA